MARGAKTTVISSARREREFESVLEAAMDLLRAGVPLDFSAMTPSRHLLSLPGYTHEKARWWNEASDARDGRLAPGGRGLFDVRLPRAMPTWIVRLDSRHMAFLKGTRLKTMSFFRPRRLLRWRLKPVFSCSRGNRSLFEDFEIRKPLDLPDPPSGPCGSSSPTRLTNAPFPSKVVLNKASPGPSTWWGRCAVSARNPALPPQDGPTLPALNPSRSTASTAI